MGDVLVFGEGLTAGYEAYAQVPLHRFPPRTDILQWHAFLGKYI